jgi:hypothetical protein
MSAIVSVSNHMIQEAEIINPIIHADFVAAARLKIQAKICTYSGCESTHSHSCSGCGSVHSFDCTCEHNNIFDHELTHTVSVADAIKFASHTSFLSLVTPTSKEIEEFENILLRFFSEWRERQDVPSKEIADFLFYDATGVFCDCENIPLDFGLQKAIQYYSELNRQGRFDEKPRYFCDYQGSGLDTVNTLDSLIYEIIVYIKNHRDEFDI